MAYGAGPGDCNSDCQICLGIEYFNSSPNTVLVQGELCVLKALGKKKARLAWEVEAWVLHPALLLYRGKVHLVFISWFQSPSA